GFVAAKVLPFLRSGIWDLAGKRRIFPEDRILANEVELHHSTDFRNDDDLHSAICQDVRARLAVIADLRDADAGLGGAMRVSFVGSLTRRLKRDEGKGERDQWNEPPGAEPEHFHRAQG